MPGAGKRHKYGDAVLTGGDVGMQDYKRLMEIDLVDKFP